MRQWISIRGPGGLRFGQSIGPKDFGPPKLPSWRRYELHKQLQTAATAKGKTMEKIHHASVALIGARWSAGRKFPRAGASVPARRRRRRAARKDPMCWANRRSTLREPRRPPTGPASSAACPSAFDAVSEPTGQRRSPDIIAPPRLGEPRLVTCPGSPDRWIGRRLRIARLRRTLLVSYGIANENVGNSEATQQRQRRILCRVIRGEDRRRTATR
jgi:hypothetical protein